MAISMRRSVVMVAVLALSALLLQSACNVLALQLPGSQAPSLSVLHHDSGGSRGNGHSLHMGSGDPGLNAAASAAANGQPLAAAAMSSAFAAPALVFVSRLAAPGAALAPPRSYYARSARILR